jgi:hypothetical protein
MLRAAVNQRETPTGVRATGHTPLPCLDPKGDRVNVFTGVVLTQSPTEVYSGLGGTGSSVSARSYVCLVAAGDASCRCSKPAAVLTEEFYVAPPEKYSSQCIGHLGATVMTPHIP